jgi:SAM-dependent methyltransferase
MLRTIIGKHAMRTEQQLIHGPEDLSLIYGRRFAGLTVYRTRVWGVLCTFFSKWIPADATVLDLGCGYCEFINTVSAGKKYAMDLNPDVKKRVAVGIDFLEQDCSANWAITPGSLDAVFTSNFLEHLPDKSAVERTITHAHDSLRPGGVFVAMGPNIKYVPGAYWDFFDHYVALTELSLVEVLEKRGFEIDVCVARFLPYSMSQGRTYPLWMLRMYLGMTFLWRLFGKQFLVVARKSKGINPV